MKYGKYKSWKSSVFADPGRPASVFDVRKYHMSYFPMHGFNGERSVNLHINGTFSILLQNTIPFA